MIQGAGDSGGDLVSNDGVDDGETPDPNRHRGALQERLEETLRARAAAACGPKRGSRSKGSGHQVMATHVLYIGRGVGELYLAEGQPWPPRALPAAGPAEQHREGKAREISPVSRSH